jgi:hypothetical protein
MKNLIWGFILGVAAMDIAFTCVCRDSANEWESNPIASLVLQSKGVLGAVVYRVVWLGYAGVLARLRTRLSWIITPVWGAGHVYLLITLIQSCQYLPTLRG